MTELNPAARIIGRGRPRDSLGGNYRSPEKQAERPKIVTPGKILCGNAEFDPGVGNSIWPLRGGSTRVFESSLEGNYSRETSKK